MVDPRFRHGADESKQIAKGEKVAGVVPHVEKWREFAVPAKNLHFSRKERCEKWGTRESVQILATVALPI